MASWKTLIDSASQKCGSDAALSRELNVSKAYVSLLRKGERPMTPELAGLIADIAGEDVRGSVSRALFDSLDRTERGKRVRAAIERGFLRGVAATFVIFATLLAWTPTPSFSQQLVNEIYIVSRKMRTWVFKFWHGLALG